MRIIVIIILSFSIVPFSFAQKKCADPFAKNTNSEEACQYPKTRKIFRPVKKLPDILEENSGLISWSGGLWTFNDSGADTAIYKINPNTGEILQTVYVTNALNRDWEEITQDDKHMYIGDFGNNKGQRKDLTIYKIKKSDITSNTQDVMAEKITFFYPEQQDFSKKKKHHWDCEAFFYDKETLHFFTKNRDNAKTYHYTIPAEVGHHAAQIRDSLDVQCQLTAADIHSDGTIVMIGYTPSKLFMWILWDYDEDSYFSGNCRKIRIGNFMVHGQAEGVCFTDKLEGYISAEGHRKKKQHIRKFNLKRFVSDEK